MQSVADPESEPSGSPEGDCGQLVVVPMMAGVGNAIVAMPMVRQLKRGRPRVRILVLARTKSYAELFRDMAEVDEIVVTGSARKGALRHLMRIRKRRPALCLIPFPSNRWQYAAIALVVGAKRCVLHSYPSGRIRAWGFVPAERVPAVAGLHDVQQNLRLLEAIGVEPDMSEAPRFEPGEEHRRLALDTLKAGGLSEQEGFVAIHPGSADTPYGVAKRWPPQRFAKLIAELHRRRRMPSVVMEGPDERGLTELIAAASELERVLVVRLSSLGHAAALLERSSLFVGNDSGLAHLAAAVGVRAVTLFGPTDPDRICPFGNRGLVVRAPGLTCAPCYSYPMRSTRPGLGCKQPKCMADISVEVVLEAMDAALAP